MPWPENQADSGIAMVDGILISRFSIFLSVLIENGGFGASPLRTSVTSILAVFSFFKSLLGKQMTFSVCSMIFH